MKRLSLTCALACLLAAPLQAQVLGTEFISATSTDCSVASSCAVFQPGSGSSMSITLSGVFVATLVVEGTSDGSTWVTVQATNVTDGTPATTAASTGITLAVGNVGYLKIRVRASAYTSGMVKVTATRGFALSARVGGGGSGGGGAGYTNLFQTDPNTLYERNGANGQEFDFGATYTDVNNQTRLRLWWDPTINPVGGGGPGGFHLKTEELVAGTPTTNGFIRISAKIILLDDMNNGNSLAVTNTGIRTLASPIYYDTIDAAGYRITGSRGIHGLECWASTTAAGDGSPVGVCMSQLEPNVIGLFNNIGLFQTTGGSATLMIGDPGSAKPTCQQSRRGMFWDHFGAAGAKDTVEICAKDATDAYAWRTIY